MTGKSKPYGKNRRRVGRRADDRIKETLMRQAAQKLDEQRGLLERIQSALNTEETGDALVQVARNACAAEQAHSQCETSPEEDEAFAELEERTRAARRVL